MSSKNLAGFEQAQINKIEAAASEWIALIQGGEASFEEIQKFQTWYNASKANAQAYQRLSEIWQALEAPESWPAQADNSLGKSQLSPKILSSTWAWMGVAASLFLVVAVVLSNGSSIFDPGASAQQHIATEVGEVKGVSLEDESLVTLSAASELQVEISSKLRKVSLVKGEAFFKVAQQLDEQGEKVPFEVNIGGATVRVLGTQFNVSRLDGKVLVSVLEGAVNVQAKGGEQVKLSPGQMVAIIGGDYSRLDFVKDVELSSIASWRQHRLTYIDADLNQVISDVARFYQGSISLSDPQLSQLRVTTSFRIDQVSSMVKMLEELLPVKVYFGENQRILIAPDKSKGQNYTEG